MRLGRIVAAILGMNAVYAEPVRRSAGDWDSIFWHKPQSNKPKQNNASQAKRRKYKRQGRK